MDLLQDQKILLCVCGGVAAYKAAALVRRLADAGAVVQVAMTANAERFVTATTFQALSGRPVRTSLWDAAAEAAMGHIELARWPDRIVIAPASANTIARLAHGLADDLVSTLCLATDAPLALAPAMNRLMWAHPATQANAETLRARGALLLGPDSGGQACGEVGEGRMMEPEAIVAAEKIKKRPGEDGLVLQLVRTADILADVAASAARPALVVGFAAETGDVEANARAKLEGKRLDLVCANRVGVEGSGFESDDNALLVLGHGLRVELGPASKTELATALLDIVAQRLPAR